MLSVNFFNKGWALVVACVIGIAGCAVSKQAAPMDQPGTKIPARVILSGLEQTYDGSPKPAGARTDPKDLLVAFTYDGNDAAPVNAGSYEVTATVQDANYEGSVTGSITIAKAGQKITFNAPAARTYGDADFSLEAAASSGLPVTYESSNQSVATVAGNQVHIVGAGASTITAAQPGDGNHLPAKPVRHVLNITKAPQSITFNALVARTYGDADFSLEAAASSGLPVIYESSNQSVATVAGNQVHIVGAGSSTITASQPGDDNYRSAEPVQQVLNVSKASARVTLSGLEQTYDGSPKRTAVVTEPEGLSVLLTYDNRAAAPVNAGSYKITAVVQDANYEGSAAGSMSIAKASQRITFPSLDARTYGDRPFTLSSTVSSGLAATYESSNTSAATISGNEVRIVGAGTAVIMAYQAGDGNYLPAEPVKQVLTVNKAPARVILGGLEQTYDGAPKPASARTDPKNLTVAFTYDNNDAAPVNAGSYTVFGTVRDDNYEGTATGSMTIAKAGQKVTFNAPAAQTYGNADFSLEAAASSGLPVSYESSNPSVATVTGNQVHIVGAGSSTITAVQPGDGNYVPSEPVQQVLTVNKAPQTITFNAPAARTYGDGPFALSSTVSSGLAATYESSNTSVATISGNEVRIVGTGKVLITAYQEGDVNHEPAEPVKQTLTVNKAPQSITFNTLPARIYGDERPFLLFSTVSSGLTATYGSSNPAVAAVRGNEVRTVGAGTVVIIAYQGGDNNYLPAEPVQQTLTVRKAPAWITLSDLDRTYIYDGAPKPVKAATSPAGLIVNITYDGNAAPPVNAGSYKVVATVQDVNYEGSAAGTITIAKAPQEIKFPLFSVRTQGDPPIDLPATLSSSLTASYESSDPSVAAIIGNRVTITGPGTAIITAFQTGDRNYGAAEPVQRVLIVRGQKPRIAVLPVDNLSRKQVPLKEIRQALIQGLIKQGASVPDEGDLERFMARHRIRYTGGVDTLKARAWKEEAGMEAVLITSVDQYDTADPPKIAITSRLVSTGEMPYILWMENIGLSGDDTPGLFGLGLINNIEKLRDKAVGKILGSLAGYYSDKSDKAASRNSGAKETFQPKAAYQSAFFIAPDRMYTVAVMPFFTTSTSSKAGEILALRFVSQLVKIKAFQVIDPGVVRQKFLNYRIIMRDGPSRADVEGFFYNLQTDLILTGRILEYQEGSPRMEFDVQVYEKKSRAMVWSSWSHNQGTDDVIFFDRGRVNNAGVLASKMVSTIVRDLTAK